MKGQFSLEQLVTMTLFVAFVSYVFFTVFNLVPIYNSQVMAERLKSEAYQTSELLINDPGNPANWESAAPVCYGGNNYLCSPRNCPAPYCTTITDSKGIDHCVHQPCSIFLDQPTCNTAGCFWGPTLNPNFVLGLSNETVNLTNYVSSTKTGYLSSLCFAPNYDGYSQVSQWLNTDRQFSILILSRNCAISPVDCRPPSSVFRGSSVNVSIKRYVAFNQNCFGELDFQVW